MTKTTPHMRSCKDTLTGKRFRWNDTVMISQLTVPARTTSRTATYLHPHRVPAHLLFELNPGVTFDWSPAYHRAALAQGWGVFDANGKHQLQKDDEAGIFEDDDQAWEHVVTQAKAGDPLCAHALQFLAVNSPDELQQIATITANSDLTSPPSGSPHTSADGDDQRSR